MLCQKKKLSNFEAFCGSSNVKGLLPPVGRPSLVSCPLLVIQLVTMIRMRRGHAMP